MLYHFGSLSSGVPGFGYQVTGVLCKERILEVLGVEGWGGLPFK